MLFSSSNYKRRQTNSLIISARSPLDQLHKFLIFLFHSNFISRFSKNSELKVSKNVHVFILLLHTKASKVRQVKKNQLCFALLTSNVKTKIRNELTSIAKKKYERTKWNILASLLLLFCCCTISYNFNKLQKKQFYSFCLIHFTVLLYAMDYRTTENQRRIKKKKMRTEIKFCIFNLHKLTLLDQ